MTRPPRDRSLAGALALAGVVLVALSLRTVVTSISPLLQLISAQMPLDAVTLGVIAAAPTIAFAVTGPFTPALARRVGIERALIAALVVMTAGLAVRAVAPDAGFLVVATVVTLLGSGMGNVLVPPLIKRYFPSRIGVVTAVYVAAIAVSGAFPALVAVPLAELAGWRVALGVWCVGTLCAVGPWIALARRPRTPEGDLAAAPAPVADAADSRSARLPLVRSAIAWSLVGLFAMCSFGGFAMLAWLPTILVETAGMAPGAAGSLLSLFAVCGLPIALVIPPLAARRPRLIVPIVLVGMASFVVGYVGLLVAPGAAPVAWILALGVGSLPYPLCFTLIGLRTRTTATALSLSGFVQAAGYVIASAGPFMVGVLHDASGGWAVPLGFLIGSTLLGLPGAIVLGRHRTVEDELEARESARAAG